MYWMKEGVYYLFKDPKARELPSPLKRCHNSTPYKEECDLHCELIDPAYSAHNKFTSYRYVEGVKQTDEQMIRSISDQILSVWYLVNGEIRPTPSQTPFMAALQITEGMHFRNAIPIKPFRAGCPVQKNADLMDNWATGVPPMLIEAYRQWDKRYFSLLIPGKRFPDEFFHRAIWQEVKFGTLYAQGTPYNMTTINGKVPTLVELCMRKLSPFNQVFGRNKDGLNSIYSLTDLFPKKQLAEVSKHNHPTHKANQFLQSISGLIPSALDLMYKATGWSEIKATQTFRYSPTIIDDLSPPTQSASGFRPGPSGPTKIKRELTPTHVIEYSVDGPKAQQIDYAREQTKRIFEQARHDKVEIDENYATCVLKPEVQNSRNPKDQPKLNLKARIFTIQSFVVLMCSMVCNGFRQKVERGAHIAIGHNWFWGGAQRIANLLKYKRKGQVIALADFWRYDKTILAQLLLLYSSFSSYYYNDKADIKILLRVIDAVASALAVKPMALLGNVCKMMIGVMPSGAYETSHGDSWINLFLFCVFIQYVIFRFPTMAAKLRGGFLNRIIMYMVYGDDNLSSYPEEYDKYLNIELRKKFFLKFFDMKLRDCETHKPRGGRPALLTRVEPITGRVLHQGPMFLQNSFIPKSDVLGSTHDMCDVVPFRSHWKTMTKFAFGSGGPRLPIDYVAASIGHAYDTKGTNYIGYQFCRFMFDYWMAKTGQTWKFVKQQLLKSKHSVSATRLFRKCGMSPEAIATGFPSRERLLSMHVWDPNTFNDGTFKATYNMRNAGKEAKQAPLNPY